MFIQAENQFNLHRLETCFFFFSRYHTCCICGARLYCYCYCYLLFAVQFQLHAVRRKKGYRALKVGLAELTDEVQAKESMMVTLAVCMYGTYSTALAAQVGLDLAREGVGRGEWSI